MAETSEEPVEARERDLYEPMRDVIHRDWARDQRIEPLAVEITALQGRRDTGGRYTRPDIVLVELKSYRYIPGKTLEVVTFEIKPRGAIDVTCVYEALAHRRAATRSFVLLHVPNADDPTAGLDAVQAEAGNHGIGMIVASEPDDYETWITRVDARRVAPDPSQLDDFIHTQLSERARDQIIRRR